jgi:hypothetical protein
MWYRLATAPRMMSNPVPGGFWVNETEKNELGKIITISRFVAYGEEMNVSEWKALLKTAKTNIKDQENLDLFLLNSDKCRFKEINDKKTYIPNSRTIPLRNSIVNGFWYDGEHISEGKTKGIKSWMRLLKSSIDKANSQEEFDNFLNSRIVIDSDGNKIFQNYYDNIKLKNNIGEFYVGERKIKNKEPFHVNEWINFLKTNQPNINSQEKLDLFLNNADFKIDEDGNKIYVPYKGSVREKYIRKNLNITNEHNITVESQKPITVLNPGKSIKILRLDFAFVRDQDILLAFEINGGQHYGFAGFSENRTYEDWQAALKRDVEKINYCHNNNIPLLILNHLLPEQYFKTIIDNLNKNPHMYDSYVPQSVAVNDEVNDTADISLEFIKRQIYSHLYPVFKGLISFDDDISKKRYIKDTLILIAKLLGIYNGGIDKTDYIRSFDANVDLTENYNICLDIYNNLYPDYPLDSENKITYNDLSVKPRIQKPKTIEEDPLEI